MVVIPVDGVSELDPVDRVVEQHVYFSQVDVALSHGGGSGIGKDGIVVGFLWKKREIENLIRLHYLSRQHSFQHPTIFCTKTLRQDDNTSH